MSKDLTSINGHFCHKHREEKGYNKGVGAQMVSRQPCVYTSTSPPRPFFSKKAMQWGRKWPVQMNLPFFAVEGGPESGQKKIEKCLPAGTGTKIDFSSQKTREGCGCLKLAAGMVFRQVWRRYWKILPRFSGSTRYYPCQSLGTFPQGQLGGQILYTPPHPWKYPSRGGGAYKREGGGYKNPATGGLKIYTPPLPP